MNDGLTEIYEAASKIGDNNPPPDLKVGDALREQLRDEHAALAKRRDELFAGVARFRAAHTSVDDDETSGALAGFLVQINSHIKTTNKTREGVKAPYLDGSRIVDAFFTGGIAGPLDKAHGELNAMQTAFLRAKADRVRREQEAIAAAARKAEEDRQREAAKAERERIAAERAASKAKNDAEAAEAQREIARLAAERADNARQREEQERVRREAAEKLANANAADRSRTRGDLAMGSLRTTWKFEVVDIALVPAEFLTVNDKLVNASISGKNGVRDIPGLRIFEHSEAFNR